MSGLTTLINVCYEVTWFFEWFLVLVLITKAVFVLVHKKLEAFSELSWVAGNQPFCPIL